MADDPFQQVNSVAELRDAFRAMRAGALEWHCVSDWASAPGVPVLHVEAADRPDVADIPRALTVEGVLGQASVGWRFAAYHDDCEGVIDVEITSPVRCGFSIAVSARHDRELLEQILSTQRLGLVTRCPEKVGDLPLMVVMSVRTFEVALAALRRVWGEREQ